MITIFTPTYNRADKLPNLYESLLLQNNCDFEWLVIDDGSTDNTSSLIKKYIASKKIKIKYIYKENGGKMSAVNMAHDIAKSDIFITVDSDDYLIPNALTGIINDFKKIVDNHNIAGIVYNCVYQDDNKKIVARNMPVNETVCTYKELDTKYKVIGDKNTAWKTNIIKKYHFPIINGEKFIADAYLMNEISRKYQIMVINTPITCIYYNDDGLTKNYFNLVKKNPQGNALYFRQLYDFDKSLYNVYGYILFSIYAKKTFNNILKNHPAKMKVLILYVPTLIVARLK